MDDLVRIFNTALLSTRTQTQRDFSTELIHLIETPAFRAILITIRNYALQHGVTEREAAEEIIKTFRTIDQIWKDYVFSEGLERLKPPR